MERANRICSHPLWKWHIEQLREAERERIFCRHGIEHLLDVARIAYIENLEQGYGISQEIIYAAALLHDIGRFLQYSQGIPHEIAGAQIAPEILADRRKSWRGSGNTETAVRKRTGVCPGSFTGRTKNPGAAASAKPARPATGAWRRKI